MTYRVLCDENVEPATVDELEERGMTAAHVNTEPGRGTLDADVAEYARTNGYLLLTNDDDFLVDSAFPDVSVLYFPDNRVPAHELARRIEELSTLVPGPSELPRVTFLTD